MAYLDEERKGWWERIKESRAIVAINEECGSIYCLFFFTILFLLTSCFGLELVSYTICWLFAVYLLLFSRELYPLMGIIPLLYYTPSVVNNPGRNPGSVFFPENGLIYIIVLMVTFVALFIARTVTDVRSGAVKLTFPKLTVGFVLLGAAYLLGGIGYEEYDLRSPAFGALEILSISLCYFLFALLMDWKNVPKDYFAWMLFCGGVLISAEVLWIFADGRGVLNGELNKADIFTGWGISNNIAAAIAMMMPGCGYLAAGKKHGWLFLLAESAMFGAVVLTLSRTAIAVGLAVLLFSAAASIVKAKGREKIGLSVVTAALCAGGITLAALCPEQVFSIFRDLLHFEEAGAGRLEIYRDGWQLFLEHPLFGTGFYSCSAYKWGTADSFIPGRWHNTIVQILASCGTVGIIAYLVHRAQTLWLLFRRLNFEKLMIALSVAALLLTSLLDCHFFNIGPGLLYSVLLCFAEKRCNGESKK